MREGRASLPGLGTLVLERQSAVVSLIESAALPPSATLSFNANLVVDDGRLRGAVADEAAFADFMTDIRSRLAARETVTLSDIGKLYQPAGGELAFKPVTDNLALSSFGLRPVALTPVVRKERPVKAAARAAAAPAAVVSAPRKAPTNGSSIWYASWEWAIYAVLASLLLVVIAFFWLREAPDSPERRVNVAPPRAARESPLAVPADRIQPAPPPRLNQAPDSRPEEAVVEVVDTAVIAIGLFGRQRNVDKMVGRLTEAGYLPYTDRVGRNTRLGVQIGYRSEEELDRVLRTVRARYAERAFVMLVNGQPRRPR